MLSHRLKMLAILTLIVFISFIYTSSRMIPHQGININLYSKYFYSESEVLRAKSNPNTLPKNRINIFENNKLFVKHNLKNRKKKLQDVSHYKNRKERQYEQILHCPDKLPSLGFTNYKETAIPEIKDRIFSLLKIGGSYRPSDCVPTETVAVIIPFSGELGSINVFLFSLHILLLAQLVEYQIFIVKEYSVADIPFKPGLLSNIGFIKAHKLKGTFTCIVFHQPYLAPTDSRNLYRCSNQPKQLVASVDNVPNKCDIGGVLAIRPKDFRKVNGFSNSYSDSESVYLDMYDRLVAENYSIIKPHPEHAKYDSLLKLDSIGHDETSSSDPSSIDLTSTTLNGEDGLEALERLSYFVRISKENTYTLIEVHTSGLYDNYYQ